MQILTLFSISPFELIANIIALAFAMSAHQFAHALVAHRAGDPAPQIERALSLNPLRYIHWMGVLLFTFFDFGLLKRAPVSSYHVPRRQPAMQPGAMAEITGAGQKTETEHGDRPETMSEAERLAKAYPELFPQDPAADWMGYAERQDFYAALLAGPLVNLVLGVIFGVIVRQQTLDPGLTASLLNQLAFFNFMLFALSFLPLPPMDGWPALLSFLPGGTRQRLQRYEMNLCYALVGLIILHFLIVNNLMAFPPGFDLLDQIVGRPVRILFFNFAR